MRSECFGVVEDQMIKRLEVSDIWRRDVDIGGVNARVLEDNVEVGSGCALQSGSIVDPARVDV